jgi:hypothetical protein
MCDRCIEIDETIARYRWIKVHIIDLQTVQAANDLMAKLEAEKAVLHPKQAE